MKKRLWRIIAALCLFASSFFIKEPALLHDGVLVCAYLLAGYDVIWKAVRNILHGQVFDENFLMCVATFGAFALRDFAESAAVMIFFQIGELFQSYAVNRSRRSIAAVMDIRPDHANLLTESGEVQTDPETVSIGDVILVHPGEKIPLDGQVLEGSSTLDTAALTGESAPRSVGEGDEVLSGCINMTGLLKIRVTQTFGESTVSKILDLVENASSQKSSQENFITKFARWYTPAVVGAAVVLAFVPPLFIPGHPFALWISRALNFLVVSCPGALVISIPMSFFGGIGGASARGILIKGGNYMEALAKCSTVVFDKTGTLTQGTFSVTNIFPVEVSSQELLRLAAHAEFFSRHPISVSLTDAFGRDSISEELISGFSEISGRGVSVLVDGRHILAGNRRLMDENGVALPSGEMQTGGTSIHVAADGKYLGYIVISDTVKPDAYNAVSALKDAGISRIAMLTGDNAASAEPVARQLCIDRVYADLLPQDKVCKIEELISDGTPGTVAFVGDGINDAPVLSRADVGIAMGGVGSDAAIEAADIVIMTDEPSRISTAIKISQKTLRIASENIVFAIGVKLIVLILSAFGLSNMWQAVFADVGVAVIAILNALRAMNSRML